ncbi:MAG: hypothetical protein J3K34DRAFT_527307 [Monoraphidium minutum]|nr:MAG: hypothetical protein J3K34DRAFT_527307 [Monoraphidium minutum]
MAAAVAAVQIALAGPPPPSASVSPTGPTPLLLAGRPGFPRGLRVLLIDGTPGATAAHAALARLGYAVTARDTPAPPPHDAWSAPGAPPPAAACGAAGPSLDALLLPDSPSSSQDSCSFFAACAGNGGAAFGPRGGAAAAAAPPPPAAERFDVVLADASTAGPAELRALAAAAAAAGAPLVLMGSGCGRGAVRDGIELAGAEDWLERPLSDGRLATLWQHAVRREMAAARAAAAAAAAAAPPPPRRKLTIKRCGSGASAGGDCAMPPAPAAAAPPPPPPPRRRASSEDGGGDLASLVLEPLGLELCDLDAAADFVGAGFADELCGSGAHAHAHAHAPRGVEGELLLPGSPSGGLSLSGSLDDGWGCDGPLGGCGFDSPPPAPAKAALLRHDSSLSTLTTAGALPLGAGLRTAPSVASELCTGAALAAAVAAGAPFAAPSAASAPPAAGGMPPRAPPRRPSARVLGLPPVYGTLAPAAPQPAAPCAPWGAYGWPAAGSESGAPMMAPPAFAAPPPAPYGGMVWGMPMSAIVAPGIPSFT